MTRENPALDSQILYPLNALALLFSIIHPFSGSNGKGQKSLHLADFSPSFEHKVIQVDLPSKYIVLIITHTQGTMLKIREAIIINQLNILSSKST